MKYVIFIMIYIIFIMILINLGGFYILGFWGRRSVLGLDVV